MRGFALWQRRNFSSTQMMRYKQNIDFVTDCRGSIVAFGLEGMRFNLDWHFTLIKEFVSGMASSSKNTNAKTLTIVKIDFKNTVNNIENRRL